MKKLLMLTAGLMCILALTACGGSTAGDTSGDTAQTEASQTGETENMAVKTAAILNETAHFAEDLTEMSSDAVMRRYGLDGETVVNAAGYAGTPAVVDEIAVFEAKDVDKVIEAANARIESQKTNYSSYAPDQVPKLDDAVIMRLGNSDCVAVCVSEDTSETISNILSAVADDAE